MDQETFRKYLIYLLKTSKLVYINSLGQTVIYYDKDIKTKTIENLTEEISKNRKASIMCNSLSFDERIPKINYNFILSDAENELKRMLNSKTMTVNEDYSLEDISNVIKSISDTEEYGYIDKDLKLYELKQAKKGGLKGTLDYIKK